MKWITHAMMLALMTSTVGAQAQEELTIEEIDRWMTELSNWGRWGQEDQLGAINLITPQKRRQAAALVKEGVSVSLARDPEKEEAADNPSPWEHVMIRTGLDNSDVAMDTYKVSFHGLAHTHLDALGHVFYQGKMYNGFSQEEVTEKGAGKLDIHNLKNGIFTRGILIDIARLKGVPYLEPGTPIYAEDLEAWERQAGIRVSSGDVVFVRTGRWARRAALGPWNAFESSAGLHASVARWLKERDVAMIGGDAANDVRPSGLEEIAFPLHRLALVAMGVHIFDNADLEALSETAARLNRWEFLFTVAPIPMPGGTGSPVNPIATF
ncbi:MAG: cyclase family protein [Acidobacteria bacterium]|nr:cyclase family protein [Acidobacteriota bacterium]